MTSNRLRFDSHDLRRFILEHGITAEIIRLEVDTPTVTAAADALGVGAEKIIKTLLFLADREPVLVIACGNDRVERKLLADNLGFSRRRVKISSAAQVSQYTGYPAGGLPPFGHRQRIRTVVDSAVYSQLAVYGGGGDTRSMLRLTTAELRRVVGNESAALVSASGPDP